MPALQGVRTRQEEDPTGALGLISWVLSPCRTRTVFPLFVLAQFPSWEAWNPAEPGLIISFWSCQDSESLKVRA